MGDHPLDITIDAGTSKELWIEQVVKHLKGENPERFLATLLANIVEGVIEIRDAIQTGEPPEDEVGN
jgi:hypothetical protein